MSFDDSYYETRLAQCRQQAEDATDPFIRDVHLKFVAHYEKIIEHNRTVRSIEPHPSSRR